MSVCQSIDEISYTDSPWMNNSGLSFNKLSLIHINNLLTFPVKQKEGFFQKLHSNSIS